MVISIVMMLMLMIMILISVAFLTLMERKILSFIQIRKGPNKVGYMGILQPFSDALKLMSKEIVNLMKINYFYYLLSPVFMLVLIMMMWMIYPFLSNMNSMNLGMIYLILCLSMSSYGLLITGWSSGSMYSMLGSIRSLAQVISYEVNLGLIFLMLIVLIESFNFKLLYIIQINNWLIISLWPLYIVFLISLMAELNRSPFDFSEGESELVSGFNVEYMSGNFILIFLSEYASILFMSFIMVLMFSGLNIMNLFFWIMYILMILLILWLRGTMPRFRYDFLMYLCWMVILPFVLNFMMYLIMIKYMLFYK
uniref:NADH-ubiquinone oxidoreductase chain 1 n=1 Tax=Enicospilus sp. MD-2008 TaxID=576951 RepID=C4NCJ3_9HYME|nr:NADH dehydrogenase subunit 1 [Enicospilus sp. MD-2008]